jgi:hypothetical protein
MAVLHRLKAWLYKNLLTPDPNDYAIRVVSERTLGIREICESAVARGGADVSAAAMEHAVNLFLKEMGYQLCDGFSVNAEWFVASPQVRGVANSPGEQFNKDKHTVLFEFHQGAQLRKELENVLVEILGVADTATLVEQVTDVKTGSVNDLLTPNRNLKISGHKIKVAGDSAANGIYFIHTGTAERIRVDDTDIVTNNPSELIVVIPELAVGTYRLEVVTQYSGNSKIPLKDPRSATFDRVLTVE